MVYMSTDAFLICPKSSRMRSWQSITQNNSDGFVAISAYLTVLRWIVRGPVAGIVAALAALDADEFAGAGER